MTAKECSEVLRVALNSADSGPEFLTWTNLENRSAQIQPSRKPDATASAPSSSSSTATVAQPTPSIPRSDTGMPVDKPEQPHAATETDDDFATSLKYGLDKLLQDRREATEQTSTLKRKITELEKNNEEKRFKIRILKQDVARERRTNEVVQLRTKSYDELESKYQELEKADTANQAMLRKFVKRLDCAGREMKARDAAIESLEADNADLKKKIDQIKRCLGESSPEPEGSEEA